MPLRIHPSLDPFSGHLRRETVVLRTFRLALLLCVLFIPAFGVALHVSDPGLVDPWPVRAFWMLVSVATLIGTYILEGVRSRAPLLLGVLLSSLVVWLGVLASLNDLTGELAVGYVFTFFGVGVMIGLAYETIGPTAWYIVLGLGLSFVLSVSTPTAETDPGVFLLGMVGLSAVLLIGTFARIHDRAELQARERLLASAERLGDLGSWTHDLKTGRRQWSAGMYRLLGLPIQEGEDPPTVADHVSPEVRDQIAEAERALLSGEAEVYDHRYEVTRSDGDRRSVHSIVHVIRGEDGEPRRLTGVVLDETEQVQHARDLDAAREQAEEAAALKSAILANMSHEIRTPLTAVIGYAQILRDETPEHLHDLVVPIETGGHRLLETLNAVLDYAQLEAGAKALAREVVDAAALTASVTESFREPATSLGLDLLVAVPSTPVRVTADEEALGRSLRHLIGNALKFTTEGEVRVTVEAGEGEARLLVSDTGQGMSPQFLDRLFEAFRQESSGSARKHEGNGLGLAVTSRLVSAMGGTIDVESELDHGTTFTIRLPLAPVPIREPDEPATTAAWIARGDRAATEAPPVAPVSERAPAEA